MEPATNLEETMPALTVQTRGKETTRQADSTGRKKLLLAESDWKKRRAGLIAAIGKFQARPNKPSTTGKRYFIWYHGREYPPKDVRSIFEERPVAEFSGGGETNEMFRDLGFAVVSGVGQLSSYKDSSAKRSEPRLSIPEIS